MAGIQRPPIVVNHTDQLHLGEPWQPQLLFHPHWLARLGAPPQLNHQNLRQTNDSHLSNVLNPGVLVAATPRAALLDIFRGTEVAVQLLQHQRPTWPYMYTQLQYIISLVRDSLVSAYVALLPLLHDEAEHLINARHPRIQGADAIAVPQREPTCPDLSLARSRHQLAPIRKHILLLPRVVELTRLPHHVVVAVNARTP